MANVMVINGAGIVTWCDVYNICMGGISVL